MSQVLKGKPERIVFYGRLATLTLLTWNLLYQWFFVSMNCTLTSRYVTLAEMFRTLYSFLHAILKCMNIGSNISFKAKIIKKWNWSVFLIYLLVCLSGYYKLAQKQTDFFYSQVEEDPKVKHHVSLNAMTSWSGTLIINGYIPVRLWSLILFLLFVFMLLIKAIPNYHIASFQVSEAAGILSMVQF